MKCWNENVTESKNIYDAGNRKHMLQYTLSEQISHGMDVSNLAYDVARELGLEEAVCHELAIAGILHDVGKINKLFPNKPFFWPAFRSIRTYRKAVPARKAYSGWWRRIFL